MLIKCLNASEGTLILTTLVIFLKIENMAVIIINLGDHQLDNEFDPIPRAGLETCCVRFSKGDYPTHLGKDLDRLVALVGMCSGNRRDVFGLQYEGSWLPPDSVVHHSTHWSLQSFYSTT